MLLLNASYFRCKWIHIYVGLTCIELKLCMWSSGPTRMVRRWSAFQHFSGDLENFWGLNISKGCTWRLEVHPRNFSVVVTVISYILLTFLNRKQLRLGTRCGHGPVVIGDPAAATRSPTKLSLSWESGASGHAEAHSVDVTLIVGPRLPLLWHVHAHVNHHTLCAVRTHLNWLCLKQSRVIANGRWAPIRPCVLRDVFVVAVVTTIKTSSTLHPES